MRSDHLSKHIKTHLNKKSSSGAVNNPDSTVSNAASSADGCDANDVSSQQQTLLTMDTLSSEGFPPGSINVMQVAGLHSINLNTNGY